MIARAALAFVVAITMVGCSSHDSPDPPVAVGAAPMDLRSPAFADGDTIPVRFTCEGANVSPPLEWNAPPRGTRHVDLDVYDPDAHFTHWVVKDIPVSTTRLGEGRPGWKGPCPPKGDKPHHYVFTIRAFNAKQDKMIGGGTLTGLYRRR